MVEDEDGVELVAVSVITGEPILSDREAQEYKEDCETIINELGSFLRVGMALRRISEKRLYREKYKTFELCVRDLFELGKSRAYQLIDSVEVYNHLSTIVDKIDAKHSGQNKIVLPNNEGQVRALLQVPKEERPDIWLKTIEQTDGKITAKKITETIRAEGAAELARKCQNTPTGKKREAKKPCEAFDAAYKAFLDEVTSAYLDGWKHVAKQEVIGHLQTIIDYIEIH